MAHAEPALLRVEVCCAPQPRTVQTVRLELAPGSTVADAVRASGLLAGEEGLTVAVWGRAADGSTLLRDRDRVELLRPLRVDPKEARRLRYRRQGGRRSGRAEPAAR